MVSKTRFTDLGYEQQGRGNWRFIDLCDGGNAAIGPSYPTKAELLADAPRFYAERWNPEAVA